MTGPRGEVAALAARIGLLEADVARLRTVNAELKEALSRLVKLHNDPVGWGEECDAVHAAEDLLERGA